MFIENYLMTGELQLDKACDFVSKCESMETLQFVLSKYSQQCKSLSSEQQGYEVLNLLEAFRRSIDAKHGPGSFLGWSPWQDFVG